MAYFECSHPDCQTASDESRVSEPPSPSTHVFLSPSIVYFPLIYLPPVSSVIPTHEILPIIQEKKIKKSKKISKEILSTKHHRISCKPVKIDDDVEIVPDDTGSMYRFPCPRCGRKFGQAEDLRRHYRIHTGKRPYSCQVCGQKFIQQGHVIDHEKRIHRVNLYQCPISDCGRDFFRKSDLANHLITHYQNL